MILSFSRNYAFIAIPKTAGHAIRQAVRPFLAPNDWEQSTRYETRLFPLPPLAAIGHGHLGWDDIQPFLLPGQWDAMFSFAVVRNPYDRFLSYAHFHFRKTSAMRDDPLGTMKAVLSDPDRSRHILLRPQHRFVCDEHGDIRVTRTLRQETLLHDFADIAPRLGTARDALHRVNAVPRIPGVELDDELRQMIGERYAHDFALFGYPLEEEKH